MKEKRTEGGKESINERLNHGARFFHCERTFANVRTRWREPH